MDVDSILHRSEVPPHVLVMALEAGYEDFLLFLSAPVEIPHRVEFTVCKVPLPASSSPIERLGKHIAVDPKYARTSLG